MKILVVGNGGREHTIVWKLNQSPRVKQLFCAPGNAGTGLHGTNVELQSDDISALIDFARKKAIDLTVVGPEAPLMEGMVDQFQEAGLSIFGPTQAAAQLEGSKVFAKQFMARHGIPTAGFKVCQNRSVLEEAIRDKAYPYVIKVDGLAAGKGALVIQNDKDKAAAIQQIYTEHKFGQAANQVLVEDFLPGEELSVFALTDGRDYVLLSPAQDHKQVYDGDQGPNTGGMGAYAPAPLGSAQLLRKAETKVIQPTIKGMQAENKPYQGVLYCGLMIKDNQINVLEFNVRFGDPEAQVTIPLVESGFLELLESIAQGQLNKQNFKLSAQSATCVVMASGGYPGSYIKNKTIIGIEKLLAATDVMPFLAGIKQQDDQFLTNGGRVLGITAFADNLNQSIQKAYQFLQSVNFNKAHYRNDIGQKGLRKTGP